jgi:hypothetical protein
MASVNSSIAVWIRSIVLAAFTISSKQPRLVQGACADLSKTRSRPPLAS